MVNKLAWPGTLAAQPARGLLCPTPAPAFISLLVFALWAAPAESAQVEGQVRLDGPVPKAEKVTIEPKKGNHSTEGCGSLVKDSQQLLVDGSGAVKNAVVWLDVPVVAAEGQGAQAPVLIDQKQCVFEPHVVAIPLSREISVRNSDSVIHNIRIFQEGEPSMLMHQWQKADAADIPWRFSEPGRYVVRCGVHHWMYSWVFVAPGGLVAVTDEAGRFTLAGVPKGRHTLHVWHEKLGTRDLLVQVREEGTKVDPIHMALPKDS